MGNLSSGNRNNSYLNLKGKRIGFEYGNNKMDVASSGALYVNQQLVNEEYRRDIFIEGQHIAGGWGYNTQSMLENVLSSLVVPLLEEVEGQYYYDTFEHTVYYIYDGQRNAPPEGKLYIINNQFYSYDRKNNKVSIIDKVGNGDTIITSGFIDLETLGIILQEYATKEYVEERLSGIVAGGLDVSGVLEILSGYVTLEQFYSELSGYVEKETFYSEISGFVKITELTGLAVDEYFKSNLNDDTMNTEKVGAIDSNNISIGELKTMTYSLIFEKMLFKNYMPVITPPSVSMSNTLYVAVGETIPNVTYSYSKGSIKVNGNGSDYGSFGTLGEVEVSGFYYNGVEEEISYMDDIKDYIRNIRFNINEGTNLYYINSGIKTLINKGEFSGLYDIYLNDSNKLIYPAIQKSLTCKGFTKIFWNSYEDNSFSEMKWFSTESNVTTSLSDESEQVIYCDNSHYTHRPSIATTSNKIPNFEIYNSLSSRYEPDSAGNWTNEGIIYYDIESKTFTDTSTSSTISYYVWKRNCDTDNTIDYNIKVTNLR